MIVLGKELYKMNSYCHCHCFYIIRSGDENIRMISRYDDNSLMKIIDDRHFRFSGTLHVIDWRKVIKSSIPHLNGARINYMMSLAGAVSLNPLILISSVVVDDTLSQSPTIIDDKSFFQDLNLFAETLIRSHLEHEVHPRYNHALESIWKTFQHKNEKVEEFARIYNDLYAKNDLNLDVSSKHETRDLGMVDLNNTMQWPWPPGECWEFSATHGGAVEGLPRYVPGWDSQPQLIWPRPCIWTGFKTLTTWVPMDPYMPLTRAS